MTGYIVTVTKTCCVEVDSKDASEAEEEAIEGAVDEIADDIAEVLTGDSTIADYFDFKVEKCEKCIYDKRPDTC